MFCQSCVSLCEDQLQIIMTKYFFLLLFVLTATTGEANGVSVDDDRVDFKTLHKLRTTLSAVTDRNKSFGKFDTCGEVINATLQASVRLISLAERYNNKCIQTLKNTETTLRLSEKVTLDELGRLLGNDSADFKEAVIEARLVIDDIKKKAYSAIKRNFQLGVKLDFNYLSNMVHAKSVELFCRLDNDNGLTLQSNLQKIYKLIVDKNFPMEDLSVEDFVNIELLLSNRDIFEKKKLDLVKRFYTERNRLCRKK